MCGIAGFINLNEAPPERGILSAMLQPLICRGPDGEGVKIIGPTALGHRRLSIIDLDGGAQPLGNEDGSVQVTFNGEIFNYRELRRELAAKGHDFRTESDTEILVHLYEEYGPELTRHLDGFFAFALYDAERRKLLLVRDRAGVKPLYYFQTPQTLVFASTVSALKRHPEFPAEYDRQALWDFLSLQYIPQGTAYRGVKRLEPGSILEFTLPAAVKMERYWKPDYEPEWDIPYEEACRELDKRVRKAVADRLIADVPLGIFLSGGVDSTIVAGLAAEMVDTPLRCYSIAFREKAYDERDSAAENAAWIRQFARHGLEHKIREVNPCDIAIPEQRIREYGQPFADASLIPTSLLSAFAREEVTVALGGDGADEMFRGYERYIAMRYLAKTDWIPEYVRQPLFQLACALLPSGGERGKSARMKRFLQAAASSGAARYLNIVSHTDELLKRSFCGDFFEGIRPTLEQFDPEHCFDQLSDIAEFDFHTYLPGDILTKADIASMSASLELRSPFLDWHVIEFATRLPVHYKEHRGYRKRILCDTFAKYLPSGLNRRRKRGFGVPLASWFRNEWKELPRERLMQGEGVKLGVFSASGLEKLIAGHLAGKDYSYALYSALMLEMFLDHGKA
ncbi:MAG: asparagine synthase (glutamine-hydrolyzing) [Lentisphaeria bacterium]|nr:asparagine synthase (glutamine-hydrolyzing) [Lentisphaeria bacterium]